MAIFTPLNLPEYPDFMVRAVVGRRLRIPFFESLIRAGFPSPAESFVEAICDINDLCIHNRDATYFVRVVGDSMIDACINEGDILVVDCSKEALHGKVCVVWFNGEHTVKRIKYHFPLTILEPENAAYEPMYVQPGDEFKIFGVVTFVIHKMS